MVYNNSANINPTGLVKADGSGGFTGVTVTQHDILIGAASNGITSVAPSATSGVPLISQGAAADPAFGTAVVAGGGTGIVSATAYGVICGGTSSTAALQVVTPGTSGYFLQSGGSAALPTWVASSATVTSGNLELLSSQTASSSATIDFANLITSTYDVFVLEFYGVIPATNSTQLLLRVGTGGTPTYDSGTNYTTAGAQTIDSGVTVGAFAGTGETAILITSNATSNATTQSVSGSFRCYNFNSTAIQKYIIGQTNSFSTGNNWTSLSGRWVNSGTAVSSLRLLMSSGNLSVGTFKLYGVVN